MYSTITKVIAIAFADSTFPLKLCTGTWLIKPDGVIF